MADDAELGDVTTVGRTELERVGIRRVAVGDLAGAQVCADEMARRYEVQAGPA